MAVGIIHRNGLILLARRPQDVALPGMWEFPGGKIVQGETPAEAAVRELHEELGVNCVVERELSIVEHQYDHATVLLYPLLCRIVAGEPQPLASSALRWVTPAELPTAGLPPANDGLILEVQQALAERDG